MTVVNLFLFTLVASVGGVRAIHAIHETIFILVLRVQLAHRRVRGSQLPLNEDENRFSRLEIYTTPYNNTEVPEREIYRDKELLALNIREFASRIFVNDNWDVSRASCKDIL